MVGKLGECVPAPTGKYFWREERSCREDRKLYIRFISWGLLVAMFGAPKTLLSFDDLLKGHRIC